MRLARPIRPLCSALRYILPKQLNTITREPDEPFIMAWLWWVYLLPGENTHEDKILRLLASPDSPPPTSVVRDNDSVKFRMGAWRCEVAKVGSTKLMHVSVSKRIDAPGNGVVEFLRTEFDTPRTAAFEALCGRLNTVLAKAEESASYEREAYAASVVAELESNFQPKQPREDTTPNED